MSKSTEDDLVYLLGILSAAIKILSFSEGFKTPEKFFEDDGQKTFSACLFQLTCIGENINKLSLDIKNKYPNIEWQKIKVFRNHVVHNYEGLDMGTTFIVVKDHVPALEIEIIEIINLEIREGNFDKEEFEIAKESEFYSDIDFTKFNFQT